MGPSACHRLGKQVPSNQGQRGRYSNTPHPISERPLYDPILYSTDGIMRLVAKVVIMRIVIITTQTPEFEGNPQLLFASPKSFFGNGTSKIKTLPSIMLNPVLLALLKQPQAKCHRHSSGDPDFAWEIWGLGQFFEDACC